MRGQWESTGTIALPAGSLAPANPLRCWNPELVEPADGVAAGAGAGGGATAAGTDAAAAAATRPDDFKEASGSAWRPSAAPFDALGF